MTQNFNAPSIRHNMQTVAFYNVENLFDLEDSKYTHDSDFLPNAIRRWTQKRYDNKLLKLGLAISKIGQEETGKHPAIVGLAEVENSTVLEDLIASKPLEYCNYDYVHFDSLDERGIDVALLYDTTAFEVLNSETYTISLTDDDGTPDYTRDILLVSGILDGETIHFIVNHWSSRREGQKESEFKRLASSNKVSEIIASLCTEDENVKIMIMGDFNDNPQNNSLKQLVEAHSIYNPYETLRSFSRGTVKHRRQWFLFDQILLSNIFFKSSKTDFEFFKAEIFDADFLKQYKGHYKGAPFRTYAGKKYKGGYSDHFPVYTILKK